MEHARRPIREYERAHGLPEDGKIGQQLAALSNAEYACETEDFELRLRSRPGRERRQSVQEVACIENRAALLQQLSQQELTLTFTLFHHGCRRGRLPPSRYQRQRNSMKSTHYSTLKPSTDLKHSPFLIKT